MNALAPLVGLVIDPAELARYVLSYGFGIQNPDKFIVQQQPAMPPQGGPPQDGPPQGGPPAAGGMQPPPMTGGMAPAPPQQVFEATGGVPPELLTQLQNQMGMQLPNS